jgi:20S proteasome subunit alpha 5
MFELELSLVQLGSCALGIKTREGVVLAVEKRVTSPLLEQDSIEKILEIDSHVGAALSGFIADGRTLIDHARVETQNHRFTYDEPMRVESMVQSISDLAMSFGEDSEDNKSKMSRPFGVSLLIGGVDANGPQLFHTDPSGTFSKYDAHAIGNGSEGARTLLAERYNKSMSLHAATVLLLRVLGDTMEEKITLSNVEVARITPGSGGFAFVPKNEVQGFILEAQVSRA